MGFARYLPVMLIALVASSPVLSESMETPGPGETVAEAFSRLDATRITTGILYDRVVPFSRIGDHDGSRLSKPASLDDWKQMYFEIYHASLEPPSWPDLQTLIARADRCVADGAVPIGFMDFKYNRIRPDALKDGSLVIEGDHVCDGARDPYIEARVFAVTALKDYTHRGREVIFALEPELYVSNNCLLPRKVEMDFDDGIGFRTVRLGMQYRISYAHAGHKTVRARVLSGDGTILHSSFPFDVKTLQVPTPDDTLAVTATIPYDGDFGSGEAYIYLSDGHVAVTDPVIVIEGFDIDNNMNWEELYEYLNQEGMVESIRADGYDVIALNFTDATDYVQRNAFVIVELVQQVNAAIAPGIDIALVGASMGGLAGRYALAYMEANALDHNTRIFISFDSPQAGANIPLGLQYWVKFFSQDSEDAAYMLNRLNTPAARQMLVYHYTDPPGTTGVSDSLRAGLLADLASVGDYPADLRKVAVANGSGLQMDQGFAPGDQIILYEYSSLLVDIIGNVWAVPDSTDHVIFHGLMDLIWPLPDRQRIVNVSETRPFDNAPGGFRSSMAQVDSAQAPYGDIIALHDNHCFIPTISALALETEDLFYDIAGDPDLMAHTPFDTLYYPAVNEEHMTITAESATWFLTEVRREEAGVRKEPVPLPDGLVLEQNRPNPFGQATTIRYSVGRSQHVCLDIYDTAGRKVIRLVDQTVPAGWGQAVWNGRDGRGRSVSPGVYFCRLATESSCRVRRIVRLR